MTKSALAELDKVRLVPASAAHDSDSGHDSDSDPESDVTIPSEIDENELYAVGELVVDSG